MNRVARGAPYVLGYVVVLEGVVRVVADSQIWLPEMEAARGAPVVALGRGDHGCVAPLVLLVNVASPSDQRLDYRVVHGTTMGLASFCKE